MPRGLKLWGPLAAVAIVIALALALAPAVFARTGPEVAFKRYSYPYPSAPDCEEGRTDACARDMWGDVQGQCTSWVAFRLNQLNHVPFGMQYAGIRWGHARHWGRVARTVGITVDRIPRRGAVAWYADGHVGYVERVKTPTEIVISEMNYDGHNGFREATVHLGYRGWPTAFIHVADR